MSLRKTVAIYETDNRVQENKTFCKMKRFSISQPIVGIGTSGTQRDHKIHNCLDEEKEVRLHVHNLSCTSHNKQVWHKMFDVVLYRPSPYAKYCMEHKSLHVSEHSHV